MPRSLILACGNPLRSDDAVAWSIAERLRAAGSSSDLEIQCAQQWTPEMAESLSRSEVVVFVDASTAIAPGAVRVEAIAPGEERSGLTTHSCEPRALLLLSREVYGKEPVRAFLVTIGGRSFEHGEKLSSEVRGAVPTACQEIEKILWS